MNKRTFFCVMLAACVVSNGCTPEKEEAAKPVTPAVIAEVEPNNEMTEAFTTGPAIINGTIEEEDDDWFKYELAENQSAMFSLAVTGEGPLNIEIRNKRYEPLCESLAVAAGTSASHYLVGAKGGTVCYVHVYPGKTGSYTIKILPTEEIATDARN